MLVEQEHLRIAHDGAVHQAFMTPWITSVDPNEFLTPISSDAVAPKP